MTPTLRAEAEKVAKQLTYAHPTAYDMAEPIADAIVAFATAHAERVEKLERLRGRIEQSTLDVTIVETNGTNFVGAADCIKWNTGQMRAELAALTGEEVPR